MSHPFHDTLGPGPYRFVGMVEIKKTDRGTLVSDPELARATKSGIGTCAHCGTAIMNCCIIRVGNGELYGVGTTCILKSTKRYEPELHTKVQLAKRELEKRKRHERKQRKEDREVAELRPRAKELLEENLKFFKSESHPNTHLASQGKTLFDYLNYTHKVEAILEGYSRHSSTSLKNLIDKIDKLIRR